MKIQSIYVVLVVLIITVGSNGYAQRNLPEVLVSGVVTDDAGNLLPRILLTSFFAEKSVVTDDLGAFELKVRINDIINVHAENYNALTTEVMGGELKTDTIRLHRKAHFHTDKQISMPFGILNLNTLPGGAIAIPGEDINRYGGDNLLEALKGKIPGLKTYGNNMLGRGGSPLVLIDGMIKPLNTVSLYEIEVVYFLPDYVVGSGMGPLAANGVLYIETKKGGDGIKNFDVHFQQGIDHTVNEPRFMNAYDYAKTNNMIMANDGLSPIFPQESLPLYNNGSDPIFHPSLNLRETLLNQSRNTTRLGAMLIGGFGRGDYYLFADYNDKSGLEKVGEQQKENGFLFNSKVNIQVNDLIGLKFGVLGNYQTMRRSTLSQQALMNTITQFAPTAFPLAIQDTIYIVSQQFTSNPLAVLQNGGYISDVHSNIIFDTQLQLNLDQFIEGLSYTSEVMVDNYNFYSERLANQPALYRIDGMDDEGSPILSLVNQRSVQLSPSNNGTDVSRTYSYSGYLRYAWDGQDHSFTGNLSHYLYWNELRGNNIDTKFMYYSLYSGYAFKNKYMIDARLSYNGSQKLAKGNRFRMFPTVGVAWRMSDEAFMKDVSWLDFLNLRTSYGVIGHEPQADYLFMSIWGGGNNSQYYGVDGGGINLGGVRGFSALRQTRQGNQDISWVNISQFSIGMDARALRNRLSVQTSYFDRLADGWVSNNSSQYSAMLGSFSAYLPSVNANKTRYFGYELGAIFSDKLANGLSFTIGANYTYYNTEVIKDNSIIYPEEYRNRAGKPSDLIWGLESKGTFLNDQQISDHAWQSFGNVRPEDIRYIDQNGDGIVDSRDIVAVGNSTPRHYYGAHINLMYKGFNLYVSGYGLAGYHLNINNHRYYQVNGFNNYPAELEYLPNGQPMPRLSLMDNDNNHRVSDYWLVDGRLFRLNNVELGYTIPFSFIQRIHAKEIKVFVRGNNVFVSSNIQYLDPEFLSRGISQYPSFRTISFGSTFKF